MTNLEYLRTLSAEEMAKIIYTCSCDSCAYRTDGGCPPDKLCTKGIAEWLNQEHEEPDSWEKLLGNMTGVASLAKAGRTKITPEDVIAWVDRISALRGE